MGKFKNILNNFIPNLKKLVKLEKDNENIQAKKVIAKEGNFFKSIFTYILIAIVLLFVNHEMLILGFKNSQLYINTGFTMIYSLLAITLPVLSLLIYGKKDLKIREEYIKKGKLGSFYLKQIFKIEQLLVFITVLGLLGNMLLNIYISSPVYPDFSMYFGMLLTSVIYSVVTVFCYELLLLIDKKVTLAPILAIVALNVPTVYFLGIDTIFSKSAFLKQFQEGVIEIYTVVVLLNLILSVVILLKLLQLYLQGKFTKINHIIFKIVLTILFVGAIANFTYKISNEKKPYLGYIDTTVTRRYTLPDKLEEEAKNVSEKIVIIYKGENKKEAFIRLLGERLKSLNSNIKFETISDYENKIKDSLDEAIYIVKENNPLDKKYVIDLKTELGAENNLKKDSSINLFMYGEIITGLKLLKLEEKATNFAVLDTHKDKTKSNISIMRNLFRVIEYKGRKIEFIKELSKEELDKYSTLMIPMLEKDLTIDQLNNLIEFGKQGGNFILFRTPADKSKVVSTPNLDKLLLEYAMIINPTESVLEFDNLKRERIQVPLTEEERKKEKEKTGSLVNTKTTYNNDTFYVEFTKDTRITEYTNLRFPRVAPKITLTGAVKTDDQKTKENNITHYPIYQTSDKARVFEKVTKEILTEKETKEGVEGKYSVLSMAKKDLKDKNSKFIAIPSLYTFVDVSHPSYANGKVYLGALMQTKQIIVGMLNELTLPDENLVLKEEKKELFLISEDKEKDGSMSSIKDRVRIKEFIIYIYSGIILITGIVIYIQNERKTNKEKE